LSKTLRISVQPVTKATTKIQMPQVIDTTEIPFEVIPLEDNVKVERPPSPLGGDIATAPESSAKPEDQIQVTQAPTDIPVTNEQPVAVLQSSSVISQYRIGYTTDVLTISGAKNSIVLLK